MDRLSSDHAAQRTLFRVDIDTHARQYRSINAAHRSNAQESLFAYVGDHETHFIHVSCDHDRRSVTFALQRSMDRTHHIGFDRVRHVREPLAHPLCNAHLRTGDRRGFKYLLQEFLIDLSHDRLLSYIGRSAFAPHWLFLLKQL